MEGVTPRSLIKRVLQTSQATRNSPRLAQTSTSDSLSRSVTRSSRKASSEKVLSSATKRPAQGLLRNNAKRRRSLTSTPSETVTPRTGIRAYLAAADTKTPAKPARTRASNQRLSQSAVSNKQVPGLIANQSVPRQKSRRTRLSQSLPTPRESVTPRAAIREYLNAVDTVPQRKRSRSKQSNIQYTSDSDDTRFEKQQGDSESATADDEQSQDEERKTESGEEIAEVGEESVQSGVEAVGPREESSEHGDENIESGDGRDKYAGDEYGDEENEDSQEEGLKDDTREHGNEFHVSPQHELENASIEREDIYASSHEAMAESSQDEQEMSGERDEQNSSQEESSSQEDDSVSKSAGGDQNQAGDSSHAASGVNKSVLSKSVAWGKLRTPVLPDATKVKATPIAPGKTPLPAQLKKASVVKKAAGKKNQAKKPTRKSSSVLRLPSSLVNGIFRHFSALKVSKDALDAVHVGSDAFFEHITEDLLSYSKHAGRKTIEESDVELLMRRQGFVKSRESFHALIEKYLPMEYRQEIIPTAKSGNKVVPKTKT